ncbi:hypothetical protein RAD15_19225 [Bradyrhizobium sp. 14AA]
MIILLGLLMAKDLIQYPAEVADFQEKMQSQTSGLLATVRLTVAHLSRAPRFEYLLLFSSAVNFRPGLAFAGRSCPSARRRVLLYRAKERGAFAARMAGHGIATHHLNDTKSRCAASLRTRLTKDA